MCIILKYEINTKKNSDYAPVGNVNISRIGKPYFTTEFPNK